MNRGSLYFGAESTQAHVRFNEAPIHESGKSRCLFIDDRIRRLASMRPRFMNRGSVIVLPRAATAGRCFNEAPIHESGKLHRAAARR